ncbi:MAG: hypothetical protein Kow0037_11230 [Calditrichia bacterium]
MEEKKIFRIGYPQPVVYRFISGWLRKTNHNGAGNFLKNNGCTGTDAFPAFPNPITGEAVLH